MCRSLRTQSSRCAKRPSALEVVLATLHRPSGVERLPHRTAVSGFRGLARSQKNFAARAQPKNLTLTAIGFTCKTAAPPVPDEPVTPVCPTLARHELHQIALDFFWVLVFCQAEPLRQADHVRVHHDPFVFFKVISWYDIGRFPANAG